MEVLVSNFPETLVFPEEISAVVKLAAEKVGTAFPREK